MNTKPMMTIAEEAGTSTAKRIRRDGSLPSSLPKMRFGMGSRRMLPSSHDVAHEPTP